MILHRWISVGSDLKFDARRDLDDVGASDIEGKFLKLLLPYEMISMINIFFSVFSTDWNNEK